MLKKIRNIAHSFIMRLVLSLIAFAFVGWGVKGALQFRNNFDIVTFTEATNITETDFLKAKAEEINRARRRSGAALSEEEINQLGLDKIVLDRLVNSRIMDYLVQYYDLDLSDETVVQAVKESPVFKNDKGEFDTELFKSAFKNSYQSEEEYLQDIKNNMLKSIVLRAFLDTFKTPDSMLNNIAGYMAETRVVDLVRVDLNSQPKNTVIPAPTQEQLQEFYKNNAALFTIPEIRSFAFLKISNQYIQNKVHITNDELLHFYDENKNELKTAEGAEPTFEKAKKQINDILKQQKTEELIVEFSKNLEDAIAAGSSLKEIATKYELPTETVTNVTYETLKNDKTGLSGLADSVFEMTEGEVSYPIEVQDEQNRNSLMLTEVSIIRPSKVEELKDVMPKLTKLWQAEQVKHINVKNITTIAQNYKPETVNAGEFKALGISLDPKFSISRSDIAKEEYSLPPELILTILQTKKNKVTQVITSTDHAYFAYIKEVKKDAKKVQEVKKSSSDKISNIIQETVVEELLGYLKAHNKMKVYSLPAQQQNSQQEE